MSASGLRDRLSALFNEKLWKEDNRAVPGEVLPGIPAVVADLRRVAAAVSAELDAVSGNAISARHQLSALLPGDVCTDFGALHSQIDAAEIAKTTALEAELVAIDAGLEHAIGLFAEGRTILSDLSDAELEAGRGADIISRLWTLVTQLRKFPRRNVTDATIGVEQDTRGVPTNRIYTEAPGPSDIEASFFPRTTVRPGDSATLRLRLRLAPQEDVDASYGASLRCCARPGLPVSLRLVIDQLIARGSCAAVTILSLSSCASSVVATAPSADAAEASSALGQALHDSSCLPFEPASDGLGLEARFDVPLATPLDTGAELRLIRLVVGGQDVDAGSFPKPLAVARTASLAAPFSHKMTNTERFDYHHWVTPCVSKDGTLYVPSGARVEMFSQDGAHLAPFIPGADIVPEFSRIFSLAFDDETGTLFLANVAGSSSSVVALNIAERRVVWHNTRVLRDDCFGLAVVRLPGPRPGQVVSRVAVGAPFESSVYLLDALSGEPAQTLSQIGELAGDSRPHRQVSACNFSYVASGDAAAGMLFSSAIMGGDRRGVVAWSPTAGEPRGHAMHVCDDATAALFSTVSTTSNARPLVVMPPAPGKRTAHLIVGVRESGKLQVVSLPDFRLVHTHELPGMWVVGLAADAAGACLVVVAASRGAPGEIIALPWPLEGMPPLE